jgi:hypothetical protein
LTRDTCFRRADYNMSGKGKAMQLKSVCCGFAFVAVFLVGAACANAQAPNDCEHGGTCTCGDLWQVNRCTGIGNNSCGCGLGFTGPSLGTTTDCPPANPGAGGCCLPTGETYSQACLGKLSACRSNAECASGFCAAGPVACQSCHGICEVPLSPAPALSPLTLLLLALLFVLVGVSGVRRRRQLR